MAIEWVSQPDERSNGAGDVAIEDAGEIVDFANVAVYQE